jgi:uncharacterized protein (TIGR03382 family)
LIGETHGRVSDAGTLVVDVEPQLTPLDATTPFGVTAAADAGVVFGALSVTASCVDQRVLSAELSVLEGATTVAVRDFTVPGPWALTVPGGCAGGPRQIVARLKEDGGLTGAIAMDTVTLDSTPVAIGAQTPGRVEVVCGTGGRARVELLPVDGACAAAATSWRVIDGPALVTSAGEGTHFELETASADLYAAGRLLTIEWSSDGGQGNAASGTRTLDFTIAPFVAVAVKASPVLRQEEAATLFEVELSNSTACAVDGLTVELPLAGAAPQVDTVQLDGARATATLEGTTLRLEGVSLPADGARVVRFAARSRLLGAPSLAPTVWLNGLEVTLARFEERPASACGCSGGGGPLFVGLMLLVVLRRRRHHGEGADQGM